MCSLLDVDVGGWNTGAGACTVGGTVAVTAAALWNRFTATPPSDARRPYAAAATSISTSVFHLRLELKVG